MTFPKTIREINTLIDGRIIGDDTLHITAINKIDDAINGELSFIASDKFTSSLATSNATCIIISKNVSEELLSPTQSYILHENPYAAIIILLEHFYQEVITHTIHPTIEIHSSCSIGSNVHIEKNVILGENIIIGNNVRISSGAVIRSGCRIGDDTIIDPSVILYTSTIIGERCILHAGCVIGCDGFGYSEIAGVFKKIPQIGNVIIGDDVEIGANTCIDRAAFGSTQIGNGVKIDNLVHIAHNVIINENSAIAAQAGIAGSSVIGARNKIAGQVGITGYVHVTDDVIIGAQAGVSKSLTKSGVYSGSPAQELKTRLKSEAFVRTLPKTLQTLQDKISSLTVPNSSE